MVYSFLFAFSIEFLTRYLTVPHRHRAVLDLSQRCQWSPLTQPTNTYPFAPHVFVLIQAIEITYPKKSEPNEDCRGAVYVKPNTLLRVPRDGSRALKSRCARMRYVSASNSIRDFSRSRTSSREQNKHISIGPTPHSIIRVA